MTKKTIKARLVALEIETDDASALRCPGRPVQPAADRRHHPDRGQDERAEIRAAAEAQGEADRMRATPTLGYPSRTAAVLALRSNGMSTEAIAARIGIEEKTVLALEASGKRSRQLVADGGGTILLPPDIMVRLRRVAAHRTMSAGELARRIIEVVLDDGIVDAVLDEAAS
jgi:hypothetical protein